ncbi:universal stress protein [Gryllotalpicola sp.]|uniref:universal stress protein n=1 Tax=Gryllotalpicola sp. TaxID=1932787 RepID=UPI00260D74FA|nr:universal stress protein [Gryllotalpicola sp.]
MDNDDDSTRILVGVDGSDPSIDALRRAATIAGALNAPITAITTWEYPPIDGMYPVVDWSPETDARLTLSGAIEKAFDGTPPAGLVSKTIQGSPAPVLIEESKHAFMLVLGSRGHGGLVGILLGSVSIACAERAHCPVLIMHRQEEAATGSAASQKATPETASGSDSR